MTQTEAALDLNVQSTLPSLAFNYEGLKAWATDVTAKYTDLVVTEESVPDIKKDMARINATRAALSEQVKGIEARQREDRKTSVQAMIAEAFAARPALAPFDISIRDEWLNVRASKKGIREAIAGIIESRVREEAEQKRLEQARQERTLAIKNHVKDLNARHGLELSLARFMTPDLCSLDTPLDESFKAINAAFATEQTRLDAAQPQAIRTVSSAPVVPQASRTATAASVPPETAPTASSGQEIRLMLILSYPPDTPLPIKKSAGHHS